MSNTTNFLTKLKIVFRKGVILTFNILLLCLASLLGGAALIGVYHTLVLVTMKLSFTIFLTVVPVATLFLAAGVIFLKDPVQNLLCLIAVFFNTVLLYLYVGAEFLAFLFLIVYVGAIAILFLFVIMLLHLKEKAKQAVGTTGFAALLPGLPLVVIGGTVGQTSYTINEFIKASDLMALTTETNSKDAIVYSVNNAQSDILIFSELLYTHYSFLFYLAAMLLLTAMLGAIVLATSATDADETQQIIPKQKQ